MNEEEIDLEELKEVFANSDVDLDSVGFVGASSANSGRTEDWGNPEPVSDKLHSIERMELEMLPEVMGRVCEDVSHRMQCPVEYVAVPLIVLFASIIGAGCAIRPKTEDDWEVIPNLWGAIVGPPSEMKTPPMMEVIGYLRELEESAKETQKEAEIDYRVDEKIYRASEKALIARATAVKSGKPGKKGDTLDSLKMELKTLEEQAPKKPAWRRYRTNDATVPKLQELLSENPRGLLVFRDELTGWLTALDKEDGATDRAWWLESWNGKGSSMIDRIGRGTTDADDRCISIIGGIQPDKIRRYLSRSLEGDNDGLVQRFQMLVYPDASNWEYVDVKPDKEASRDLQAALNFLANTDFSKHGAHTDSKHPYLHFSPEAQKIFIEWQKELKVKTRDTAEEPVIIQHLAKYGSLMPSLALIFHLVEFAGLPVGSKLEPISKESALMAAAWCAFLEGHARRVYGLASDRETRAALSIARRMEKGALTDGFRARDIQQKNWSGLKELSVIESGLSVLVQKGWLQEIHSFHIGPGRPPAIKYIINPKVKGDE